MLVAARVVLGCSKERLLKCSSEIPDTYIQEEVIAMAHAANRIDQRSNPEVRRALIDALAMTGDDEREGDFLGGVQRVYDRTDDHTSVLSTLVSLMPEETDDENYRLPGAITRCLSNLTVREAQSSRYRIDILTNLLKHREAEVRHDAAIGLDRTGAKVALGEMESALSRESSFGTRTVMTEIVSHWRS